MSYKIYGKNNCIWCERAKDFLSQNNEDWSFYNIETSQFLLNEFREKFPTARSVPQILHTIPVMGTPDYHIGGYDDLVKWYFDRN